MTATQQDALAKSKAAITAFLTSAQAGGDNYVGGVERLLLEDALKAFDKAEQETAEPLGAFGMQQAVLEHYRRICARDAESSPTKIKRPADIVQITGPSGCGKSSLAGVLRQLLEARGCTVWIEDGAAVLQTSKEVDFVLNTVRFDRLKHELGSGIKFISFNGMMRFYHALIGAQHYFDKEGLLKPAVAKFQADVSRIEKELKAGKVPLVGASVTYAQIQEWAGRHSLQGSLADLKVAFEDARTLHLKDTHD